MGFTGSCKGCGDCCRMIELIYPNAPEIKDWCEARGMILVQETQSFLEYRILSSCKQLENSTCKIYAKRPKACRDYPHAMLNFWISRGLDPAKGLMPHCGFKYNP